MENLSNTNTDQEYNHVTFSESELAQSRRVDDAKAEVLRRELGAKMIEIDGVLVSPAEAAQQLDPDNFMDRTRERSI